MNLFSVAGKPLLMTGFTTNLTPNKPDTAARYVITWDQVVQRAANTAHSFHARILLMNYVDCREIDVFLYLLLYTDDYFKCA